MVFYFNPENISYAIPLYIKVGCEWLKTKWKIVIDCEPTRRWRVRARNKRNSKRNNKKKKLLKWRRACGLSNLPWLLATCSYQEVLLQQVQATLTWNKNCCLLELNHGLHVKLLTKLWFCRKLSGRVSWDSLGCFCISIDILNYTCTLTSEHPKV